MNKQLAAKKLGISYNTLWRVLAGKDCGDAAEAGAESGGE